MNQRNDQLPVIREEVEIQKQQITALVVSDESTLAEASDRIKAVKDLAKKIKTESDLFTAPAKEIISAAKAKYDPFLKALEAMEKVLKDKAQDFILARARKQKAVEEKLGERVAKGTMRADTAIRKIEAMPDSTKTRGASSGLRVIKRKDVEAMLEVKLINSGDPTHANLVALVEGGYLVWDMVKVRRDALAGAIIPGVRVIEVATTQSVF